MKRWLQKVKAFVLGHWYWRAREEEDNLKAEVERRQDLIRRELMRIKRIQEVRRHHA